MGAGPSSYRSTRRARRCRRFRSATSTLCFEASATTAAGPQIALSTVKLKAPVPLPLRNIMCVGKNYHEHAKEFSASGFDSSSTGAADAIPTAPIIFTKVPQSVIGPDEPIRYPTGVSEQLDYEAELAVIIGKGGRGIAKADALKHVWGYTIINDVTARDLQGRHKQWFLGKSLDTFCPMGPWVVTADEVDLATAGIRLLGQRRAAPGREDRRPDLRHPDPDRDHLGRHHAVCRATSSPPARRPASASASSRRSS